MSEFEKLYNEFYPMWDTHTRDNKETITKKQYLLICDLIKHIGKDISVLSTGNITKEKACKLIQTLLKKKSEDGFLFEEEVNKIFKEFKILLSKRSYYYSVIATEETKNARIQKYIQEQEEQKKQEIKNRMIGNQRINSIVRNLIIYFKKKNGIIENKDFNNIFKNEYDFGISDFIRLLVKEEYSYLGNTSQTTFDVMGTINDNISPKKIILGEPIRNNKLQRKIYCMEVQDEQQQ